MRKDKIIEKKRTGVALDLKIALRINLLNLLTYYSASACFGLIQLHV